MDMQRMPSQKLGGPCSFVIGAILPGLQPAITRAGRHTLAFRPNEFLIESLRDHSTLSVIWLLTKLCERARSSFASSGPTWFGFTREENPEAEADILVLVDGKAMVCEVKSSWRALRSSDLSDFVTLAGRLRPDAALLGIMEAGSGPTSELDAAEGQLRCPRD